MGARDEAAMVCRSNGAYLVVLSDSFAATEDLGVWELAEAAPSLPAAKRVAVRMAESVGFTGGPRWAQVTSGSLKLLMHAPDSEG